MQVSRRVCFALWPLNLESYLDGNLMPVSNYVNGRHYWLAKVMYCERVHCTSFKCKR